uniref:Fms related receptor tyrosine kinase 1 n=1 Tax=Rousettus aegyptiacus TaxID=9407 RepID=A0A7J8DWI0_ROUAE|nr:fms related receptor tyrosine kinase 1 [Rousettus aegyptiacus]
MPAEPGTCSQGKKSFRRKKLQSEIRKRHTCCAISATTPWPSAAPPLWTVTPTASPSLRSPGSKTTTKYNKSPVSDAVPCSRSRIVPSPHEVPATSIQHLEHLRVQLRGAGL